MRLRHLWADFNRLHQLRQCGIDCHRDRNTEQWNRTENPGGEVHTCA